MDNRADLAEAPRQVGTDCRGIEQTVLLERAHKLGKVFSEANELIRRPSVGLALDLLPAPRARLGL